MTDEKQIPNEIFAYHSEAGTGTWIDFDDSCEEDKATSYTRTDIHEELKAENERLREALQHIVECDRKPNSDKARHYKSIAKQALETKGK